MAEAKNFLYAFCGKRKVKPTYNNTNTTDGRFQAQVCFFCQILSDALGLELFLRHTGDTGEIKHLCDGVMLIKMNILLYVIIMSISPVILLFLCYQILNYMS